MSAPETPLSPEIVEQMRRNSQDLPPAHHYDLLVSLAGFSPQTTAQAYLILEPGHLHILHSKDTKKNLSGIEDEIRNGRPVESRSLNVEYTTDECLPTDPLSIYRSVKAQIDKIKEAPNQTDPRVAIDITGGKKVMSAAAALAAWQLNTDLVYAENDSYDAVSRSPQYKAQAKLLRLANPMHLFREQEEARIDALFNTGQFERADEGYRYLSRNILVPEAADSVRCKAALAALYTAWRDFDRQKLSNQLKKFNEADRQKYLTPAQNQSLSRQLNFLRDFVSAKLPAILPIMFYFLGVHYQNTGHYDFAGQLFYRCLETIFRTRLELRFPGFETEADNANYQCLINQLKTDPKNSVKSEDALTKRYYEAARRHLNGFDPASRLPRGKLTYVNSAVLLTAIDDDMIRKSGVKLRRLQDISVFRNKCFLNHGDGNITKEDCEMLRSCAADPLKAFQEFHPYQLQGEAGVVKDALDCVKTLAFIKF